MSSPGEQRDASRPTTADVERIGEIIDGRYRLDALVGKGGMGLVYKAAHVGIRRTVALKLLHTTLAQVPELRSRFEREARAIGVISHPNCVDVTDFGELADGSLYLVMEYLEGQSLGDLLDREHAIEARRALRILRHVLAGLGHAHSHGIVHRDVKPENVLLVEKDGDRDFAKILDFGIAKLIAQPVDDGVKLTQAGVAFGTPVYMSPEQALGNPVDPRADLYAASVMGFEMIAGRPPFYSDDKLEVLSMHTARPVPSLDEYRRLVLGPDAEPLPLGVERLLLRGLAKQPRDRWPNADEYIAAIDELLVGLSLDEALPEVGGTTGARPLIDVAGRSLIDDHGVLITPTALSTVERPLLTPTDQAPRAPAVSEPVLLETRVAPPPVPAPPPTPARPKTSIERLGGRVRQLARDRPMVLLASGAGAIALVGIIVLAATRGGDDRKPPPSEAATQAAEKLDHGDPQGAIKALEQQKDQIADDPSAQLQLGHAYAARRDHAPALVAYARALELEHALCKDPTLRANLATIADDTDLPSAMRAYQILITTCADADARAHLLAAAIDEDAARRHVAYTEVAQLDLGDQVDWLHAYLLDLDQGDTCEKRRDAVAKLRALGDARAVPGLQAAIERKGKTGHYKGKAVNSCLADAARAAVSFLQSLAGADAGP